MRLQVVARQPLGTVQHCWTVCSPARLAVTVEAAVSRHRCVYIVGFACIKCVFHRVTVVSLSLRGSPPVTGHLVLSGFRASFLLLYLSAEDEAHI